MTRQKWIIQRYAWWCLAAVCIGWGIQVSWFFVKHDGLPLRMCRLGSKQAEIAGISRVDESGRIVVLDGDGFDGQFFYLLGADPLLRGDTVWRALGAPQLRARRIGLAWVGLSLGFGKDGRAIGLLSAQSLSLLALLALLQFQAFRVGIPPWLCVAIPLLLPVLTPLAFVTAELLAGVLVVGALVAAENERSGTATLLVAFACLCKEICVLVVAALVVGALVKRRWRCAALYGLAAGPLMVWMIYLGVALPVPPHPGDSLQNLGWPLVGAGSASLADFLDFLDWIQPLRAAGNFVARGWYLAMAIVALSLSVRRPLTAARTLLGLSAMVALVLSSGDPASAYDYIFNFARQLFLLPLAAVAILFLEWKTLPWWGRIGLQVWIWAGAVIGLGWAVRQILF